MSDSIEKLWTKAEDRKPTWAEVRAARLNERKYPYCPSTPERFGDWLVRMVFYKPRYFFRYTFDFKHPIRRLRAPFQFRRERMAKGWSEADWWSIDRHLARIITETCRKYRDEGHGYPMMLGEGGKELHEGENVRKWNAILTEIADGFDGYVNERYDAESPQFKRAMTLFSEWFGALWD